MDLNNLGDKAKEAIRQNPEAAKKAVDKARDVAAERIGAEKAQIAHDKVNDFIDSLTGESAEPGSTPAAAPEAPAPAAPEGEPSA